MIRYSIVVRGIVQGVGFRPFVFRLAKSLSLAGFVQNTPEGVYAEIEGEERACEEFLAALQKRPPVLARIDRVDAQRMPLCGDKDFVIRASGTGAKDALISPDIGICAACAADIADKNNRRYRYAFTNCTDCGPRFSIIRDVPYDRKNTTMAGFLQCKDCKEEYENPFDRRFHAQPNACPACGPHLGFYKNGVLQQGDPISLFGECVKNDGIVALKGLGGYHLACDAANEAAVARLRRNKIRFDKPFALMLRDIGTVRRFFDIDETEEALLLSEKKPIVLLQKTDRCAFAESIAPENGRLGVMLPYTPLHGLIMQNHEALVMTSANLSDSPMIFDDEIAINRLFTMADAMLSHNRPIFRRVDDSVCMAAAGAPRLIRRARGYVPEPVKLNGNRKVILSLGAQQKNTFCLAKGENAFLSGHIGDLDDMDAAAFYESEIESFQRLFEAKPEAIACDIHPDYVSTRYAERYKGTLPVLEIQHHHAHFASVLAEHHLENAVGLIFDGTGYGTDGAVWGGEALFGGIGKSERIGHLLYAPLFGGEAAIREPWRMALAMLDIACGRDAALDFYPRYADEASLLLKRGDQDGWPLTSGAGRLFDAAAALAGIKTHVSFEGQAAVALEGVLDDSENGSYGLEIGVQSGMMIFDWRQMIRDIVDDVKAGCGKGVISAKFHRAMARLLVDSAVLMKKKTGCNTVALSGGVFQNAFLLGNGIENLQKRGFQVYSNEKVPANDGGISFGQAAAAAKRIG